METLFSPSGLTLLIFCSFFATFLCLLLFLWHGWLQDTGCELLQHLQVCVGAAVLCCCPFPDTANLHGLEDVEPLALGYQLIPLLCFQLLTNLLVLWVTLLQPRETKELHPCQGKNKINKKELFKFSFAWCSLSHTGLLEREGAQPCQY